MDPGCLMLSSLAETAREGNNCSIRRILPPSIPFEQSHNYTSTRVPVLALPVVYVNLPTPITLWSVRRPVQIISPSLPCARIKATEALDSLNSSPLVGISGLRLETAGGAASAETVSVSNLSRLISLQRAHSRCRGGRMFCFVADPKVPDRIDAGRLIKEPHSHSALG